MPTVKSTYGAGNALRSEISREGLAVPAGRDFWADLNAMMARLPKPAQTAGGSSLRSSSFGSAGPARHPYSGILSAPMPAAPAVYQGPNYANWRPSDFGRPQMTQHGVWGTYINPANVPVPLQGYVPTGFFADDVMSNYTYSPLVDPRRYGQPAGGRG